MDISKQNKLIAYYTGGTNHAKRAKNDVERLQIAKVESQFPLISQPICERCERIGLWDKEYSIFGTMTPLCQCLECGAITKNPLTFGEYLANGYDLPAHMSEANREIAIKARKTLNMIMNIDGKDGRNDEIFK